MGTFGFENLHLKELNKANVFRLVEQEVLWRHYLGFNFIIGNTYKSPFGDDKTPSFSIYYNAKQNKICAKDHRNIFSGDIIDFICFKEKIDFFSALIKINLDFNLGLSYKEREINFTVNKVINPIVSPVTPVKQKDIVYHTIYRSPSELDILYWKQYGISRKTLRMYNIFCVNVLYCNGVCIYTYTPEDPCYQYTFRSGNKKYYRPYAEKKDKFRGNVTNDTDIQGYYQCRVKEDYENKKLVLTKSMKDIMLFREYDIDAMGIHGELQKFNKLFIEHLKRHYKIIYSLYDRDATGVMGAKYLWKTYNIIPIFIPKNLAKDLSDTYKFKGEEVVTNFIKTKLN